MINLDKKVETVLESYHQRMAEENALMQSLSIPEGMSRRDEFLLSVGTEVGILIRCFCLLEVVLK